MKVRLLLSVALIGLLTCVNSFAIGMPKLPGAGGSASAKSGDPDVFLKNAGEANAMVNASAAMLFEVVASKEQLAKVEALRQQLASATDPKEKEALQLQICGSQMAGIAERSKDESLQQEAATWEEKKKEKGKAALYNLALGAIKARELVPEGQGIASSLKSNPMMVTKAKPILQSVDQLSGIVTGAGKVVIAMPPVFSAAKIEVEMPKSSADTPKTLDNL